MKRKIIAAKAPDAISPYSHGIIAEGIPVYVSGQLPVNKETGEMPEDNTGQTEQSLENLIAVLEVEGMTLGDVVKTTVYLSDIDHFNAMNQVYSRYFEGTIYPARSAFEVANLPKGALVEIEAIAIKAK